jgi:hypothetical protein
MPAFINTPVGGLDLTRYLEDKYTISYKQVIKINFL